MERNRSVTSANTTTGNPEPEMRKPKFLINSKLDFGSKTIKLKTQYRLKDSSTPKNDAINQYIA